VEDTDVVLLWGSNARDAHPIFFHHVLKAVRHGARLFVVDPRRTSSAEWADTHLPLHVGSDIALSNAVARVILDRGLEDRAFIERATLGFDAYRESVEPWTLDRAERVTGVPRDDIERMAVEYAKADRAQICWTLGITEHHDAVDNVLALINLGLLTGHVGRYGCGLNPLRGQNNVQGGGDMGALPHKLTGFQDVEDDELRAKFEKCWDAKIPPKNGWHLTEMFEAMDRGDMTMLYCLGENPAQSEADSKHCMHLLENLEGIIAQDIVMTKTAAMADVVLPGSASWCEADGTVTNSERRVQRVRKAVDPPGNARDDIRILADMGRRLGRDLGNPTPEQLWNELRTLSPMHAGMSYERLEKVGGLQWPCADEQDPGASFLHGRLWADPVEGMLAPFTVVRQEGPLDLLTDEFPLRLTTGRRLDSFNTGVQTRAYENPLRMGETVDVSPEDARRLALTDGEVVRISSRRGSVTAPVRVDDGLREGLCFMTMHFPDEVDTNILTIDATDPKSGTAEFKASAVRIDKVEVGAARV
jgi:formate dehydrogenase major subunit